MKKRFIFNNWSNKIKFSNFIFLIGIIRNLRINLKCNWFYILFPIFLSFFQEGLGQILNYETKISINEKGQKTTEKTYIIKINSKEQNWMSHIEIGHNPDQVFVLNYAMIINSEGNVIRKLKKKDIITRSDISNQAFYQDELITEFDLYWNQYPYQIKYSYSKIEDKFLYITRWTPVIYTNVATLKSNLSITIPPNYSIYINHPNNLSFNESQTQDGKTLKWSSGIVKAPQKEIYAPPLQELLPLVSIVPANFNYGINGSYDSWPSFGFWLNKLNEGTDNLPLSEKIVVNKLIEGISDKKEIIKTIYHYLQDQTKYINVAIEIGGLKSYPASYVSKNKYGDCKALTTYMKSMLKSAGIESYYTVINAGSSATKVQSNFPSQQFNHVILAIPYESDTIWLENTSNFLPFNYLGTFTQNRLSLITKTEKSELRKTPKLQIEDVLQERRYKFYITEQEGSTSNIMLNLRGEAFEDLRYAISNQDKEKQLKKILNLVNLNGFNLTSCDILNFNRDSTNLKISITGNSLSQIRKIGDIQVINPLKIDIPNFEKPSERDLDVRINFPINQIDYTYYYLKLLPGKKFQIPKSIDIDSDYGFYQTSYNIIDKGIEIKEIFTLYSGDYTLEEYPKFYSFIKSIIEYKKNSAIAIK